ncbi:MAG TPA: hypothetical protein VFJ13_05815, partial [Paracoccaceae bacterium]|nr:hypothetical protein [Paracoccaceae bacterium]
MPDTLPILFLDDGGVLNDNTVRAQQWQRLVGEFMPPRLGGTPAGWAEANRVTVPPLLAGFEERSLAPGETYADWERACDIAWLRGMCGHLGIEPPPDDEAARIGREAEAYICARVRSAFPGAAGAVRRLAARGFTVHTASDKSSTQLHAYLAGMGIRQHFGHLFGPDLVDEFKWRGPGYY